jgi:tRNA dimethylallyltransferase
VGKTWVGVDVALRLKGEVLTCDSMQVYRHMDIGTAKPTLEERRGIPHHLMDLREPYEPFSVAQYQTLARQTIAEVADRGHLPIFVGGTGLYVKSLVRGYTFVEMPPNPVLRESLLDREASEPGSLYRELLRTDPIAAEKIHVNDHRRIVRALEVFHTTGQLISDSWGDMNTSYDVIQFGLTGDRNWLYGRIERRVDQMLDLGLAGEVGALLDMGCDERMPSMQGLGYKEMLPYLRGEVGLQDCRDEIVKSTRHFAKRQYTWFRPDKSIVWLDVGKPNGLEEAAKEIARTLEGRATLVDE